MPADSVWEVQKAVYARLCAVENLTALLAAGADSVFDHVPQGAAFPYVVIGEVAAAPLDIPAPAVLAVGLTLHAYSRGSGMKELRGIMAALHAALHDASLAVDGHAAPLCLCQDMETRLEGDGLTRHGLLRCQIIVEEETA